MFLYAGQLISCFVCLFIVVLAGRSNGWLCLVRLFVLLACFACLLVLLACSLCFFVSFACGGLLGLTGCL